MKVNGNYGSLIQGVSQAPEDRRKPGQHTEMVNMVADPAFGLRRRPGSVFKAQSFLGPRVTDVGPLFALLAEMRADTASYKTFSYSAEGSDYDVVYRSGPKVPLSTLPLMLVYNKTQNIPLTYVSRGSSDPLLASIENEGIGAITAVGAVVFASPRLSQVLRTETTPWQDSKALNRGVIEIKSGEYSTTYSVRIKTPGNPIDQIIGVTTPSASYPLTLSTTDIPAAAPDYQKQVNDRVNAYNSEVTKWIGDAAKAITPEEIAKALYTQILLQLTGAPAGAIRRAGSVIVFDNAVLDIGVYAPANRGNIDITVNEVTDLSALTTVHFNGHVVRVQSAPDRPAYYLRAEFTGPASDLANTFGPVRWVETAGEAYRLAKGIATFRPDNAFWYAASGIEQLNQLMGEFASTKPRLPVPGLSTAGDLETNPTPHFFGRRIDYLGVFQDRLLVGSGGVISASAIGEYFRFSRSTVLTVPSNDPFEVVAEGRESDPIKHSVTYLRDVILFSSKAQYSLSGREPLTPLNASLQLVSSYNTETYNPPLLSGAAVLFCAPGVNTTSLYQLRPTNVQDNFTATPMSSQLRDYLPVKPTDACYLTNPRTYLIRDSIGDRNSVYVWSHTEDNTEETGQNCWHKWKFGASTGTLCGLSTTGSGVTLHSIRMLAYADNTYRLAHVVDDLLLDQQTTDNPYLDSQRPGTDNQALQENRTFHQTSAADVFYAYPGSNARSYVGAFATQFSKLRLTTSVSDLSGIQVGVGYDSYVKLTPVFERRQSGEAVKTGLLTVSFIWADVEDTSGLIASVTSPRGDRIEDITGRRIDTVSTGLGKETVSKDRLLISVGEINTEYALTISARQWRPLQITGLSWEGQNYSRGGRL